MQLMQDTGASDAAVDASDPSVASVEGLQKDMARLAFKTGLFCETVTSAFADALDYYNWALEICIKINGHNHMSVAATYTNMGVVYDSQSHYERALEYYQKSLDIKLKVVGHDHISVADSKYNLALLHKSRRETDKARQLFLECEQTYSAVYGADHSETQDAARQASQCV